MVYICLETYRQMSYIIILIYATFFACRKSLKPMDWFLLRLLCMDYHVLVVMRMRCLINENKTGYLLREECPQVLAKMMI